MTTYERRIGVLYGILTNADQALNHAATLAGDKEYADDMPADALRLVRRAAEAVRQATNALEDEVSKNTEWKKAEGGET